MPEYQDMYFPWLATTDPLEFNSNEFITSTQIDEVEDVESRDWALTLANTYYAKNSYASQKINNKRKKFLSEKVYVNYFWDSHF